MKMRLLRSLYFLALLVSFVLAAGAGKKYGG